MRIKDKSLEVALAEAHLQRTGLPKQYKDGGGDIWIRAVVLVVKSNLEECYCLYSRSADGYMSLDKDCGSGTGIIQRVIGIYPYLYLDKERFCPSVCSNAKRSFLKTELSDRPIEADAVDLMSDDEVNIALIAEGIKRQLQNLETDMLNNAQMEGNDLDGTNRFEMEDRQFQAELAEMKASGASKTDMRAFIEQHEKERQEILNPSVPTNEEFLSEADELRKEMEEKDLLRIQKEKEQESKEGEFDVPDIDLEEVRAATEQYRREQILIAKRKFKRRYDGQDKFANGSSVINELGEIEEVETIALPVDASDKQKEILKKAKAKAAKREAREAEKAARPKGKPGRPKGSTNKKTSTRKVTSRTKKQ